MAKNRFKVGDKVRVKNGLKAEAYYGGTYFNNSMANYCGKELTIEEVLEDGRYFVEESGWYWAESMFEKPKNNVKVYSKDKNGHRYIALNIEANSILAIQVHLVKVIENGETVICFFRKAGKDALFKTVAKCQKGDTYNLTSGLKICCHKANIKFSERALKKF